MDSIYLLFKTICIFALVFISAISVYINVFLSFDQAAKSTLFYSNNNKLIIINLSKL